MDLLKWIKSLDELLFELMSWMVFWPLTLVRTLLRPLTMMRYADAQLSLPEDDQYAEALSPPVFLVVTLVVTHLVAVAMGEPDVIIQQRSGIAGLVSDDSSALVVRIAFFAAFPMMFSIILLIRSKRRINRTNLQWPFYAQCYPTAVFAAILGVAGQFQYLHLGPQGASGALILAAALWLVGVEAVWLRKEHGAGWVAAGAMALAGVVAAGALVVGAALLLVAH